MSVAVVTGASRGIGRATALGLARRGADLALVGRPSPALHETLRALSAQGVRAEAFETDLADPEPLETLARRVLERFGTPHALINNAGLIERASVEETTPESWDRQLAVNLRAPFLLTRALLPALRAAGRGRIVNVGSISGTLGCARAAAYAAAKWGLIGLTKSLAEELTDTGVSVVAVLPGSVDTGMLEGSGFEPRMTPEEVASTLVHFALDAPLAHNGGVIEMFGT
ncbi:MAG: SDR family NAD(P)-dependent oxidoreductase [Sorangiineae bacterium]|nr:SDR family NAD(P)-dependent oxidoreductase [Polyangiaceae bacterium]MEB2320946.1 SDR family NAD(P)-dependent oxidoreductase [Sorangiineae bacterium]